MFYIVEDGDTLAKIADKFYGDRIFWQIIYDANQDALVLERGVIIFIPPCIKVHGASSAPKPLKRTK
ncbi:LysM peptidoglycan-binding domain-containing protein [Iningainema tapete]|uniref:LysM peptidoglycan-binding domain-containing protein n=1 Tax=Iningainema tapete BLCC-T55 TaxID=2748662 RepID=A0A8J7BZK4_9CYAN|nr:LysM peptidoglycan-binding domain-containing protein [Iningainema tapete]MBD2777857.1 LysM peptidoglycan-binding domain-containing protein [Iningainema tapete BLCC-T55]